MRVEQTHKLILNAILQSSTTVAPKKGNPSVVALSIPSSLATYNIKLSSPSLVNDLINAVETNKHLNKQERTGENNKEGKNEEKSNEKNTNEEKNEEKSHENNTKNEENSKEKKIEENNVQENGVKA